MIAPAKLPEKLIEWNRRHGAPAGKIFPGVRRILPHISRKLYAKYRGPYAIQPNNTTRTFEYPWAFYSAALVPGQRVVEIGGGLSGFQFTLDRFGCDVVNVDPGHAVHGSSWRCDSGSIAELNKLFGTHVELRNTTVEQARLEPCSFDRAFSISVLEHLSLHEVRWVLDRVFVCLKPGGYFVLTVDLFLDLSPFTSRLSNKYGVNIDIFEILSDSGFVIEVGNPNELNGFAEFDPDQIMRNLSEYFIGRYPALIQCLVLRKPVLPSAQN